jgi:molybdate transport system regulatory protein
MTPKTSLEIRLRIRFEPGGPALGPGKIDLLEQIAAGGSLVQAASELGMSYRRAWALVQELASMFGRPVVETTVGGAAGGGAELTPFAHRLVAAYRSVERTTLAAVSREFAFAVRARSGRSRAATRAITTKSRRETRRARARR